ncbi:MAG: metal-dependent hydrolase [Candidatus Woesearchaeota archaeon]
MLFYTHLLFGVAFFLVIRGIMPEISTPLFLVLVLFGSVLPDIDEPKSKIHRWSGVFGSITTALAKHRGFFHSLLFMAVLYAIMHTFWSWYYGFAVVLGFLAHMIGDGLTPMGINLFYPFHKGKIRGPIKTGGVGEKVLMGVLLVFIVYSLL